MFLLLEVIKSDSIEPVLNESEDDYWVVVIITITKTTFEYYTVHWKYIYKGIN